ncbi:DUF1842 domain-containing protein [Pseudoalteromonas obscura]|uniref:DUF1842 domain-containing protein n=1 Tax=Pseudoalteromonas obscura TaxID=3048491 RepID=A0ABT7ET26_9GAMM|nr:DUF1842 domain-containing protein [Pseudoalteromonas sp. P94(2023)]MDK2598204.1 DUF1842 domain-containing protein [Pseudoalteromonas sp. P94(2023)]
MLSTSCGINGLFLANYILGYDSAKPICQISLLVYVGDKTISGRAKVHLKQSGYTNLMFHLNGEFHYQQSSGSPCIAITLLGQQPQMCTPRHGVSCHYIKLDMLLNDNWRAGQASFSYKDLSSRAWCHLNPLKVKQVYNNNISDLAQLSLQVKG